MLTSRAGHSRFFRAFALASAKLNKKRGSAKKSESAERERKKARIRAFLSWGNVCLYVCMYILLYVCTYVFKDVHMYVGMLICGDVCI